MKDKRFLFLAVLLFVAIMCYVNVIEGEFQFDDDIFISENPRIGNIVHSLRLRSFFEGNRPVTNATFDVNYRLHGLSVEGYHIVNLVLHLMAGVLVYLFTRKVFRRTFSHGRQATSQQPATNGADRRAVIVAAVFLLHPVQTQAVSYIVQRGEVLASIFYLLGLISLIGFVGRHGRDSILFWSLGMFCFVLGWASKQIIVTMPVVFLMYVVYFLDREKWKKAFIGMGPVVIAGMVLGIIVVMRFEGSGHVGFDIEGLGQPEYLYTEMRVLLTYLRLIFLPIGQNLDHDYRIYRDLFDFNVTGPMILWSVIIILSFYSLKIEGRWKWNARVMGFGMLWFIIILLPTSSFIPLKDIIFEHRVYLAMLGIVLAVVSGGDMLFTILCDKYEIKGVGKGALGLICIMLLTLSIATYRRNFVWQTKMSMWRDVVKKSPNKSRAHNNLGNIYLERGDKDKALHSFMKAVQLNPRHFTAYNNIGLIYLYQQKYDRAERYFRLALEMSMDYADPHINLGALYMYTNELQKAVSEFEKALRIRPNSPGILNNLGAVYSRLDDHEKALKYFSASLALNPSYYDAIRNLALACQQAGNFPDAVRYYQKALKMKKRDPHVRFGLARCYLEMGNLEDARKEYELLRLMDAALAKRLEEIINKAESP